MNKSLLLELEKKLNIPRQNCMETKEELEEAIKDTTTKYKEIAFSSDTPICMAFLDELRKQQAITKEVYDQKLMDDTLRKLAWDWLEKGMAMDGDRMIDRRTGEMLDPEVNSTYWKDKFQRLILLFLWTIKLHAVRWRSFLF